MIAPMTLAYLDRVIVGCWQLAQGHGRDVEDGAAVLEAHLAAGFRVLDCADIYTGVEALIGEVTRAHGLGPEALRVHTKYVPDLAALPHLRRADVERAIDRSRARLHREVLDLVQFHWWDYRVPGYLDVLDVLTDLQRQGTLRAIGLTNFDAAHLREILDHGVPIASLQVQYSLLDRRPARGVADLARDHGVDVLAYGSVAGGLLSDAYLGQEDLGPSHENRSLTKYRLILDELGGWEPLQALLPELRAVADGCDSDVASVASGWALQRPGVRACIVGVRSRRHVARLAALRDAAPLAPADIARLDAVRDRYPEVPGEVYELERDRQGRHGRIIRYGLNEVLT
jgi:aryl-alcohol dehydrogenase-like predicted oxidoreductase